MRRAHWDSVYGRKTASDVSWYQERPQKSLEFIQETGVEPSDALIDAGGGASTLVDYLLAHGYRDLTVLDISANALQQAKNRLASRAAEVDWRVADVTRFDPDCEYRLWHDRAVLHFLVEESDRARYVAVLKKALAPGGYAILATFGPDGPQKCSGLPVRRYDTSKMCELLGPEFELLRSELDLHKTPGGAAQQFLYTVWQRSG
jgi:trans-aconitate methyltransferase